MAYDTATSGGPACSAPPHRPTQNPYRDPNGRGWKVIDATGCVPGRLACEIANIIRGKNRPDYSPNTLNGDHVIVINAAHVAFTGRKREQKVYYRHTGHPGGLKARTARQVLEGKHPERVLEKAVWGMLPKNTLQRAAMRMLHVYPGPEHPHEAQQPETYEFSLQNAKNLAGSDSMPDLAKAVGDRVKRLNDELKAELTTSIGERIDQSADRLDNKFTDVTDSLRAEFQKVDEAITRLEQQQRDTNTKLDRNNELLERFLSRLEAGLG